MAEQGKVIQAYLITWDSAVIGSERHPESLTALDNSKQYAYFDMRNYGYRGGRKGW
ncbi:MAG: hypothetical protein NZM42_12375 [Gemmatales bacterium]|nr:hypothetical protein [Gemmatales bacterium]MDW8223005.1 hypothetical protein [Gemmatales bacterium]